jgi:hypothetical protein
MKITHYFLGLLGGFVITVTAQAQNEPGVDSTGLPGDNFSLPGALKMFQKASSPEDFEKSLNSESNHVNNLDLNDDGEIDYIRVVDNSDKEVHAFVLQAVVSETESQDIAVIELEKTGDTTAVLQIVGDKDIYGEEVIIEPDGGGDSDGAFIYDYDKTVTHGPAVDHNAGETRVIVNVWFWPSVRFVYGPRYVIWRSPYRWRNYPGWWRPWRPVRWHAFRPFHAGHRHGFVVSRTHRVIHAHRIYTPLRTSSVTVRTRHATAVNGYRVTRTKTTVTGPRGNKATRTTTTVKGRGGDVKARKTTTRRR